MPKQQPEQQAPPVQRLRIRYAKRGRLRFTSHRDFSRAFERALQRARVPMAFSSGFNPHPRISYANAAPTGAASEAEYLEIGLATVVDPEQLRAELDESLPEGLDIVEVVPARTSALPERLEASHWHVTVPSFTDLDEVRRAVGRLLETEEVMVERMTKKGLRTFDARTAIVSLSVLEGSGGVAAHVTGTARTCAILDLVLRHGTPSVRPDDVLAALCDIGGLDAGVGAVQLRLAQGPLDSGAGTVGDPLAPDRDAAG